MIFYGAVVLAAALAAGLVVAVIRLILRKGVFPAGPARWRPAVAAGVILASSLAWYIIGGLGRGTINVEEPKSFFIFWGVTAAVAAAFAVLLGLFVTKRKWWRHVGRWGMAAGAVGFVAVLAGQHVARATRPVPHGPNVVFIVLDAWRADAFYDTLTPNLYSFGENNCVYYKQARSCASWTVPSMSSIFTGQYVDSHAYRSGPCRDEVSPTLAQLFRNAGYDTTALVANRLIDRQHTICEGFDDYRFWSWPPLLRGLHFFHTNWYGPAMRTVTEIPLGWETSRELTVQFDRFLNQPRSRPYFLWVHYMDPHSPYTPPPGYYLPRDEFFLRKYKPNKKWRRFGHHRLYLNECTYMDDLLGWRILPKLAEDDNTIVIITGDHGEEFWEHGVVEHGKSVYEPVIRVPMLISVPGQTPAVVNAPVSQIDLAPTILKLAGLKIPPSMQGKPLPFSDAEAKIKPTFVGSMFTKPLDPEERKDAVIAWPYKLIVRHEDMSQPGEFYDLSRDRLEENPLPEDETAARLRARIQQWKRDTVNRRAVDRTPVDVASEADLRALGYIQ
jgi:arylsulfatase A-like enzyme